MKRAHEGCSRGLAGLDHQHVGAILEEVVGDGIAPAREEAQHRRVLEAQVAAGGAKALELRGVVGVVVTIAPVVNGLEVDVTDRGELRSEINRLAD